MLQFSSIEEFEKWQGNKQDGKTVQERKNRDDKILQEHKNRLSNARGQQFEEEILAACQFYMENGIAVIHKTPEPFKVMKKLPDGMFTGRFTKHAQPDFQGTLKGGRSIVFEAKQTGKDRILRRVLTQTQMDQLEEHDKLGALCGVCINIRNSYFFIPWSVWRNMKQMYGRLYITEEDVKEYQVPYNGTIKFLANIEESGDKK